jgi:hypothetical protein
MSGSGVTPIEGSGHRLFGPDTRLPPVGIMLPGMHVPSSGAQVCLCSLILGARVRSYAQVCLCSLILGTRVRSYTQVCSCSLILAYTRYARPLARRYTYARSRAGVLILARMLGMLVCSVYLYTRVLISPIACRSCARRSYAYCSYTCYSYACCSCACYLSPIACIGVCARIAYVACRLLLVYLLLVYLLLVCLLLVCLLLVYLSLFNSSPILH